MSRTSTEAAASPPCLRRYTLSGSTMGTRWTSVLHSAEEIDAPALASALAEAVDVVERQMSTWKPQSDLMRLNGAPVGQWVALPRELLEVLAAALRIGRMTHGAFDIGVGGVVAKWGFGVQAGMETAGDAPQVPRLSVDWLELDAPRGRARKNAPLTLDLSGIAKGYGVDELARVCHRHGIASYLVGIDGELHAKGVKPDGEPYAVALEQPDPEIRAPLGVIELADCAIATSGDYRHRRMIEGGFVSHTVDPRSGLPLRDGAASVTVLAPNAMEADALATALLVLGEKDGLALARAHGLDALMIGRGPTGLAIAGTGRFADPGQVRAP